jgi:signal peptidase I
MDKKTKQENNTIRKKSLFREYVEAALIAIFLALLIRTFVVQAFKIPSGSMEPTLLIGDHILVNKFIYGIKIPFTDQYILQINKPKRGDVVVFKWPKDEEKDFIKRVIGIAGDKIEIKDDMLYVNDEKITTKYIGIYKDKYINTLSRYLESFGESTHYIVDEYSKHEHFGPVIVPENSIFVMGDNRDNSHDSRYWGFVSLPKLKGKAMIIYWSWPNWKRFGRLIK